MGNLLQHLLHRLNSLLHDLATVLGIGICFVCSTGSLVGMLRNFGGGG